jgi:Amidase
VSTAELVTARIERIERLNRAVDAVVTLTADRALAAAREADDRRAQLGGAGGQAWLGSPPGSAKSSDELSRAALLPMSAIRTPVASTAGLIISL